MSDKSKHGRHKPKSAASAAESSPHQSDASSSDNRLSKPEPASPPASLQKEPDEIVEVDESTNKISIKRERIFGTNDIDSTCALVDQVAHVVQNAAGKLDSQNVKWALATICGIGPKDELEGLLAAQMIGVHSLAMVCLGRASREDRMDGMDAHINHATKLLRTFTTQMEALNRHRGKGGQSMVVGNVNVNEGGQAIVGPVSQGGHGKASPENDADKVE